MTTNEENKLLLRPVRWDDAKAVTELMYLVDSIDGDEEIAQSVEELEHGWRAPGFNPETDAFVVENEAKEIVGFWESFDEDNHVHIGFDGYIHPDYKNTEVGDMLIRRAEQRALEHIPLAPAESRVFIRSGMTMNDKDFIALHEKHGFTPVRYFWRMEIELENAPEVQPLPNGLEFRPFNQEEHAHLVLDAENETFRDHWGSHDIEFAEWHQRKIERPEFDPTLWLVVWEGDQIAGFSQNRYMNDMGWVSTLGVRRPWRKKGLGLALLTHSFAEFYKRDVKRIGLGVDAASPTGATRLYQKAGMSPANEYVSYEKELRPAK